MKKVLTLLTVLALTATITANAAESRLQNYVNKKISPLTQKEQQINSKIEAQKKADAAKRAELEKKQAEQRKAIQAKKAELEKQQAANKAALEKKQAENKAALEKAQKDAKARQDARKKAIETEKNYWKSLFNK